MNENGVRAKTVEARKCFGFIVALSGFLCLMTGIVGALNVERCSKRSPGLSRKRVWAVFWWDCVLSSGCLPTAVS